MPSAFLTPCHAAGQVKGLRETDTRADHPPEQRGTGEKHVRAQMRGDGEGQALHASSHLLLLNYKVVLCLADRTCLLSASLIEGLLKLLIGPKSTLRL